MRERVLQAAMDMLASDGVAEFTTRRLAQRAGTSTPAVYELFGDKAGLVREVFFESFRLLRQYLDEVRPSQDPRGELISVIESLRMFAREHPVLTDLMFSRPFADFDPGTQVRACGRSRGRRSRHRTRDRGHDAGVGRARDRRLARHVTRVQGPAVGPRGHRAARRAASCFRR
jgi:AcrR family transcriptional regulator